MPVATYRLLVDWGGNGTLGDGTGEDVTARTLSVDWNRGRDYASQLTGRSQAGRLTAVLNNQSGDYSPFNASSPLYGSLLPGRKVQLTGTLAGTSYTLWTGYLDKLNPEPILKRLNTAKLEAIGPLGMVNQKEVSLPMLTNMLTGTIIGTILDKMGWGTGTAFRALDGGQTTINRYWTQAKRTLEAMRQVEETEAGFLVETKDGKIAFEDRYHRLSSPHTASQATFTDGSAGTLLYSGIMEEDPLPAIFNDFQAKIQLFSLTGEVTLWTMPEVGTHTKIERDGGTRVFWAYYPNPDSPSDGFGVDSWTTPGTADMHADSNQSGTGGTDLTANIGVAVTKLGNTMKITLTNNNPTADAYIGSLQSRGTALTKDDPVYVSAEDGTSQTKYGQRTYPNPAEFLPDTEEAQNWCNYNLGLYKNPIPVIAITIPANRDNTHLQQAMQRDISERITVIGTGAAGLGLAEECFIEAEYHRVGPDRTHEVTWQLSWATRSSGGWVLDASKLDVETKLVY